ncbi:MAG: recombination protein RecR [Bacteroidales bacterium]|nr:recombination protein RecR [Bacteroidales bacterium]
MYNFPSRLLENAVNELAKLPGIGRKTALRMALHLLRSSPEEVEAFGNSVIRMRREIVFCSRCQNISDKELCDICASPKRDASLVCVVEDIRDVMAIENTAQYTGVYHVLGGIISPIEGIGPQDLNIASLVERVSSGDLKEIILALPSTIEGDTTNFYLFKKMSPFEIPISMIARGISIGDELEHTDEVTLGRSILNRTPYQVVK